jgi:hypothetical protein
LRPDGVSLLNGDAVGRGVTNSKPLFGGGTGVTVLGQKTFNETTMQKVRDAVNELVKGRNVIVAYNDAPTAIVTPETGAYEPIPLSLSAILGTLLFCVKWHGISINVSARYKVTAEIGFDHSHGHDLEFGILVNGLHYDGLFKRRKFRSKHKRKRNIRFGGW